MNSQTDNSSEKLGNDNRSVLSSFGLSDHCLLCVVRLEVFQEKATKGQEEGKRWEGEGDEHWSRFFVLVWFIFSFSIFPSSLSHRNFSKFHSETNLSSSLRRKIRRGVIFRTKVVRRKTKRQELELIFAPFSTKTFPILFPLIMKCDVANFESHFLGWWRFPCGQWGGNGC